MAVKIRLKRLGKIHAPFYRVVVADSRTRRDGRAIEEIGKYHPTEEPSLIQINRERAQYWLGVGAQPTEQVLNLLKITGDWQTFKGEPGSEGTLRVKEPKPDKKIAYESAMRDAKAEPPAKKAAKPRSEPVAAQPAAEAPAAEAPAAEAPVTEAPATEAPATEAPVADAPAAEAPADEATTQDA